jgi:hypothetical protein
MSRRVATLVENSEERLNSTWSVMQQAQELLREARYRLKHLGRDLLKRQADEGVPLDEIDWPRQ